MVEPLLTSAVLVGYGSIGRFHARLLDQRWKKLAIVDKNESILANASNDFPEAGVALSLADLDSLGWDWASTFAVIATWGPSHATLFHELVGRGVSHILCEKPLAHSVVAGAAMVKAAENPGVALGVHHTIRYMGFAAGLKALAQDLGIGNPCAAFISGGARGLVTNGIHYVDLASQVFERGAESVISTAAGAPINPRSRDLMFYGGTAVWGFGEGRELTISFSNQSSVYGDILVYYRNAVVEVFPNLEVEVRCRRSEELEKYPAITRTGVPTEVTFRGPVPGIQTRENATKRVLDEIEVGRVRTFPPSLALEAVGACIGALASGLERREVRLPIDPESKLGKTEWPIS